MFWNTNKRILEEVRTLNLRLEFLTIAFLAQSSESKQPIDAEYLSKLSYPKKKDKVDEAMEYMDANTSIEEDIKRAREQGLVDKEKDFFEYNDDSGIGLREELIEEDEEVNV